MARNTRTTRAAAARNHESVTGHGGETGTEIEISMGEGMKMIWDASALEESAREGLFQRIVNYCNSQMVGLPHRRG